MFWMIHIYYVLFSGALKHSLVTAWHSGFPTLLFHRRSVRLWTAHGVVVHGADSVPLSSSDGLTASNDATVVDRGPKDGPSSNADGNMFDLVASLAADCLFQSDLRRDAIGKAAGGQASSATNWIHDASAFALQKTLDQLCLDVAPALKNSIQSDMEIHSLRWFKSIPCPAVLDFSNALQSTINTTLTDDMMRQISQQRPDFLSRLGCRLILLPSGTPLPNPLSEPPASIVYGQLLYGGVTRCRLLAGRRKAGERTEVKPTGADRVPTWMMYGGPDRLYESVDMGAAAVLEVLLLPRGQSMPRSVRTGLIMRISGVPWQPQSMFHLTQPSAEHEHGTNASYDRPIDPASFLSGRDQNEAFCREFRSTVGGLQPQIDAIVRRVLDGRVIRPVLDDRFGESSTEFRAQLETKLEAEELELLGLTPVRGLLLYGPPGCGTFFPLLLFCFLLGFLKCLNCEPQAKRLSLEKYLERFERGHPRLYRLQNCWIAGWAEVKSWSERCLQMPNPSWPPAITMPRKVLCM
jgi:hypothetical protein